MIFNVGAYLGGLFKSGGLFESGGGGLFENGGLFKDLWYTFYCFATAICETRSSWYVRLQLERKGKQLEI